MSSAYTGLHFLSQPAATLAEIIFVLLVGATLIVLITRLATVRSRSVATVRLFWQVALVALWVLVLVEATGIGPLWSWGISRLLVAPHDQPERTVRALGADIGGSPTSSNGGVCPRSKETPFPTRAAADHLPEGTSASAGGVPQLSAVLGAAGGLSGELPEAGTTVFRGGRRAGSVVPRRAAPWRGVSTAVPGGPVATEVKPTSSWSASGKHQGEQYAKTPEKSAFLPAPMGTSSCITLPREGQQADSISRAVHPCTTPVEASGRTTCSGYTSYSSGNRDLGGLCGVGSGPLGAAIAGVSDWPVLAFVNWCSAKRPPLPSDWESGAR